MRIQERSRTTPTNPQVLAEALAGSGLAFPEESTYPVFIRMLGYFRVFKIGHPLALGSGVKMQALLSILALHPEGVPRDSLHATLWPNQEGVLARQLLNSLVYSLRKLLHDPLIGAPTVVADGCNYRLSYEAGVAVDLDCFERLVSQGDRAWRQEDFPTALTLYNQALLLYTGDLCNVLDVQAAMRRERLRVSYLGLLIRLADYHYKQGEYDTCLDLAGRILATERCREDAHRLMMRCYIQRGERAQALRQYQLCVDLLQTEYCAPVEAATTLLYEQIRLAPNAL